MKVNVTTDFKQIGYDYVSWIQLAENNIQRRDIVNTVTELWVDERLSAYKGLRFVGVVTYHVMSR
jgi:hypothetical protein